MIYRGKPSLGCALCRKRRLTCDQRRPSCSQCLRVKQECSGYRDPTALRIYDQTQEVATKAKAKSTSPRSSPPIPEQSTSAVPFISQPSISNDERALSQTFPYYVGTVQSPGILSYLPSLLSKGPSPALQATVKAMGLASMPGIPESKQLAAEQYSIALRATNVALRDPASALSDSTLGAVLMLSAYEMITCQASNFLHDWMNHVRGATKLLELRGPEQLDTQAGLEMFTLVRIQNAMTSMFWRVSSQTYISPKIAALSQIARTKRNKYSLPVEDLYDLLIRLNDLAVEADGAPLSDDAIGTLAPLIAKALNLDAEFQSWAMSQSPVWRFTVVENPHAHFENKHAYPPMYGDRCHTYYNVNIASMWNHYRQSRMILNTILKSMSLRLWELQQTPESQQLVFQCLATITQLVEDVCASVPYFFTSGEAGFGGTIRLLWPLFFAVKCTGSESPVREWIMQTLDGIGRNTGLQQAVGMSRLLREGNLVRLIPGS